MKTITSRQHPFVGRCRTASRRLSGGDQELLLDGVHLVGDALDAGVRVEIAAVTAASQSRPEVASLFQRLAAAGTEILTVSDSVMNAASPVRAPSGVVALGLHRPSALDEVFGRQPALVAGIVGVQDPGNVGAIIRAAEAAGATGVVVTDGSADPFGWKALRGAMGSAFRVRVAAGLGTAEVMASARARGVRCVAAVPGAAVDLFDCDLTVGSLVLLGGEGTGLDATTVGAADIPVRIPMAAGIESLNVAVAAGVILFEAFRQRTGRGMRHQP